MGWNIQVSNAMVHPMTVDVRLRGSRELTVEERVSDDP